MKTSLKERKYVEMHVSILESGDGGLIKENIARGGIFMRDQEITELFWERKEQAVTESNIRYGAYCRRISYNILANKEDVEECMNDTWYQAWNAIPPQRPLCLKAFFGKIIRNLSLNRWKWDRAGKRIRPEAMFVLDELGECVSGREQPEDAVLAEELKKEINRFLHGLSAREQGMFVQRYFYLESIKSIARYHGITENAVSVNLNRVRKQLKQYLSERGYHL